MPYGDESRGGDTYLTTVDWKNYGAVYYGGDIEIVKLSRRHNDANILSIGARFLSKEKIFSMLETWLKEPYTGGRHQNRLNKLDNFHVN